MVLAGCVPKRGHSQRAMFVEQRKFAFGARRQDTHDITRRIFPLACFCLLSLMKQQVAVRGVQPVEYNHTGCVKADSISWFGISTFLCTTLTIRSSPHLDRKSVV